jgi:drug/metabolite transporter (DMT)-like permease
MSGAVLTLAAGVPAALAAAASFGISSVLQYGATHEVPSRPVGQPRLLVDLVRRPQWRWSIGLAALGFALQVLALRLAPLTLVQPLLITGVLWYVVLAAMIFHRRIDRVIASGTLLCVASLSAFLVLADPAPAAEGSRAGLSRLVPLALIFGAVVVACVAVSAASDRRRRALPLALATGICYGATAALVRSLSSHFGGGLGEVLGQWETYAILVLGPLGVLFSQNAYQAGPMGAPALTIITVTDPLVSIAAGVVWLGESVHAGTWRLVGEALALAVLSAGVLLVASRAPHVTASTAAGRPAPEHQGARSAEGTA